MQRSCFCLFLLLFAFLTFRIWNTFFFCCYSNKTLLCGQAGAVCRFQTSFPVNPSETWAVVNSSSIPCSNQAALIHEGTHPGKISDVLSYFKLVPASLFRPWREKMSRTGARLAHKFSPEVWAIDSELYSRLWWVRALKTKRLKMPLCVCLHGYHASFPPNVWLGCELFELWRAVVHTDTIKHD